MKKFNYFLLIAIISLFTSNQTFALTTYSKFDVVIQDDILEINTVNYGINLTASIDGTTTKSNDLELTASKSTEFIANNLTLLYAICIALVLFNLLAQIKIIFQMVHLFFQFQKEDEFAKFNFQ